MSSIRVLVVTNLWPYEGDPSYGCFVRSQMESLRPFGVDYSVLFINGCETKAAYWKSVGKLRKMVRSNSFDLVHAHMGLAGWVARCQFRLPLVVSFLGNDVLGKFTHIGRVTLYDRFLIASSFILARMARAVIVKSEEMKQKLGLASARVIPTGVDLEVFRPVDQAEARRALGLDLSKKLVLFPYDPKRGEKRYDVAAAAVQRVRRQYPDTEILCVYGVAQEQMPLYLNAADTLVLASQLEGSPNTVKEALAVNLPVVAVNVGDTPELLRGTEGNYLAAREPEAIAAKILAVFQDGRRARSREQMARLSIEKIARQVMGVYESMLAGGA
ncbi:MAG: glycosyltransferase family 4 protein [Terriglobia bacterium]